MAERGPRTAGAGARPPAERDGGRGYARGGGRDGDRLSTRPSSTGPRNGGYGPSATRTAGGFAGPRVEPLDRPVDPFLPDDVEFSQLDREVRGRLRTLSKEQAERAGKHLVMVARLIDSDPEQAYLHAQAAVRRAGRVDVAHEAAGLAAYRSGRYAEALRELRTVRRLNGSPEHLPVIADAERGLGRPERAIVVGNDPDAGLLTTESRVELAMVISGARLDLGEPEAAVAVLDSEVVRGVRGVLAARVAQARATALAALGRAAEADLELSRFTQDELDAAAGDVDEDDEVVVFDLLDEDDESDDDESDDDESDDDESDNDESDNDESDDDESDDDESDNELDDEPGDGGPGERDEREDEEGVTP